MISPFVSVDLDNANGYIDCLKTHNFESDHAAVELCLTETENNILKCQPKKILDYSNMNVEKFNDILESNIDESLLPFTRVASIPEIDKCILNLNESFEQAINSDAIPKIISRNKGQITLPPDILDLIKEKKQLRRTTFRCLDPRRKATLEAIVRNLSKIISDRIRIHEDSYWSKYFASIKMNSKTYKKVKGLCGLRNNLELPELHTDQSDNLDYEGGMIQNDGKIIFKHTQEKIQALSLNFENVHKQNLNIGSPEFSRFVINSINELDNHRLPIVTFNESFRSDGSSRFNNIDRNANEIDISNYKMFECWEDIKISLSFLNNKKSYGEDNISNFLLRKTGYKIWNILATLFNHCFNIGYYPHIWKCAKIIAIPKPGANQNSIKNYRPISLLSNVGKLFEEFLLRKIQSHLENHEILKDTQTGFRKYHSTNHALSLVNDFVSSNLNNRHATIALSIDLEKAFDTAWHEGIIYKMYKLFNFDLNICRILNDYLKGRSFFVEHGDDSSLLRDISAGVPQGSLLGPYLFNIYLADLPQPPLANDIQNVNMFSLSYADDVLILASHQLLKKANYELNKYIVDVQNYFIKWKLKINPNKCECVVFKGTHKHLYPNARKYIPNIKIDTISIQNKKEIKYLGVKLQEKFTFKNHFDYILKKAKNMFFAYANLIRRAKDLKSNIKLNIYKQIIRPIIGYAFPCWFNVSSAQMERLRVFERYILRICSGLHRKPFRRNDQFRKRISNKTLYTKCKIVRIDNFLIKGGLNFLKKLPLIPNRLIQNYNNKQHDISFPFTERYISPIYLKIIENQNLLYRNKKLLFYHRRYNTFDIDNTVYNLEQFIE